MAGVLSGWAARHGNASAKTAENRPPTAWRDLEVKKLSASTQQLPGVFPSLEHHDSLRQLLREKKWSGFSDRQKFEWVAYTTAWQLERLGTSQSVIDPAGEWRDPVLVAAARPLWERKRLQRSLDPGDYSWAKTPADRARFEAQDRERTLYRSMFLSDPRDAVNADGSPSQAALDYVQLCVAQASQNFAHMQPLEKAASESDLGAIRRDLGIGPAVEAA
jgi:hypothetical protein